MDLGERRFAVVGVDQHPVRQHLTPMPDALDVGGAQLVRSGRIAQLEHFTRRMLLDQFARRTEGDDLALVHHHQPVAELLGLVHVVGREHQRDTALFEPVEAIPQHVAGLRVETGGRLVEQQQFGLVDQRPGDRDAPLHATGQRLDLAVGTVGELHELEQLVRAPLAFGARDVEVAAVQDHVVGDRQLLVELVHLRHHAHPGPDLLAVLGRVESEDPKRALGDRGHASDHPHRRRLAGTVRAEEAERLAAPNLDVDPVDGHELTEALHQLLRADQRLIVVGGHADVDDTRQVVRRPGRYHSRYRRGSRSPPCKLDR